MTNEQILQEINEAIKQNGDSKRNVNDALSHAATALRNMTKAVEEAGKVGYECGAAETFKIMRRISRHVDSDLFFEDMNSIFGTNDVSNIIRTHSLEAIIAKLEDYDNRKKKLTRGDEVHCCARFTRFTGIYLGGDDHDYWILEKNETVPQQLTAGKWTLTKTGKHVDIFD